MTSDTSIFRVSLTNVTGLGATELVTSLLPALERAGHVTDIYLPANGAMAGYNRVSPGPVPQRARRRLPNAISRLLECTLLSGKFEGDSPLLVLGDLPLRIGCRQVVFVHTPHLLLEPAGASAVQRVKFGIARAVFRTNVNKVGAAIVQTATMQRGLKAAYPMLGDRIYVIAQPPPDWLLKSGLQRKGRVISGKLRLFYPAAAYPHKNHALLYSAAMLPGWSRGVDDLIVTVPPSKSISEVSTVQAVGRLSSEDMQKEYALADALVFPSLAESYGLPLVEAMWLGLPIICADLPYSRDLCGEEAIYFSPNDPESLERAITELSGRLAQGWWPDWQSRLQHLPTSWDEVAERMCAIVHG